MNQQIKDLIEISKFYGSDKSFVIAGGGNTSYKDEKNIWVKASGYPLAEMNEEELVALSREKLRVISQKIYPEDPLEREEQVKNDLLNCVVDPSPDKRPSVETSLHDLIRYRFVVHLHPSAINGILCSRNAKNLVLQLFGDRALFVQYTDPGYTLFRKLESEISLYREKFKDDPQIIMLENHGVFTGADSTEEIKRIYSDITETAGKHLSLISGVEELPYNQVLDKVLPVIRMVLSEDKPKIIRCRNNTLISKYYGNQQDYHKISLPLTPDIIAYCKPRFLYIEQSATAERILDSFRSQLPRFMNEYGFLPKVIVIKNMGVLAVDDDYHSAETTIDVFEDLVRISHYAQQCGGIKFLTPEQVSFIDKWEVENYRRETAKAASGQTKLADRVAIVTGGAQGFGAGIARSLYNLNVNVVIADINEEAGLAFASKLNKEKSSGRVVFIKTDVSDPVSVRNMVSSTLSEFGGLDIMVSNAGILKVGGLEEIEPDAFARTTDINYKGYFYCAKYSSEVMKLQNQERPEYFSDIIQINSKSGLHGSNRNFAYSGSKFGGIGLTQSFALELAPFRIKVNSICPGNFYEGPLWSDPRTGLFIQYLQAGKVPGAKTVDDVRKHYEDQVPLKRGCLLEDVMKAILYVIDQDYETGQSLPVTGGQVMLG